MYSQMLAGPVTETQTTQSYKPGELVITNDKTYGTRVWRYIKNTDSISMPIGTLVERKAATSDNMSGIVCVTAAKRRGFLLGVTQSVIAAASFGFVLKEGQGTVLAPAAGTITAGDIVCSQGTAGTARTAVAATLGDVIGVFADCLVTTAPAGALTACNFYFP